MKFSASVPANMHSTLPQRRGALKDSDHLSGFFVIKAHPLATKEMHVKFTASADRLKISFSQTHHGVIEDFELCDLSLQGLVVGWTLGDPFVFALAAEFKGKLHGAIYCCPTDNLRNSWLLFFRQRRLRTAPFGAFDDEKTTFLSSVRE